MSAATLEELAPADPTVDAAARLAALVHTAQEAGLWAAHASPPPARPRARSDGHVDGRPRLPMAVVGLLRAGHSHRLESYSVDTECTPMRSANGGRQRRPKAARRVVMAGNPIGRDDPLFFLR